MGSDSVVSFAAEGNTVVAAAMAEVFSVVVFSLATSSSSESAASGVSVGSLKDTVLILAVDVGAKLLGSPVMVVEGAIGASVGNPEP
jgi:hypothetical protein